MLDVFFTVDTEVWCGGWTDLDDRFPEAFRRYVYGPTPHGDYALPMTLSMLGDHGLTGVFFVEPLFARRFSLQPLEEIVGLIQQAGHEIQLHLHTEWVDESTPPILPGTNGKRQFLRDFSAADQIRLIEIGTDLLTRAGAPEPNAFRAGNFAANNDTFAALSANGIEFDTSYDLGAAVGTADMARGRALLQPERLEGVSIMPVTVFHGHGPGRIRHLQLTACSFEEMVEVLSGAEDRGWQAVVIVSHNFELLTRSKTRRDPVVVRRFRRLCQFLERNEDRFNVRGFSALAPAAETPQAQPQPFHVTRRATARRFAEQAFRRCYR